MNIRTKQDLWSPVPKSHYLSSQGDAFCASWRAIAHENRMMRIFEKCREQPPSTS